MKRIDLIAGARPNFMKIAPIIDALNAARSKVARCGSGSSIRDNIMTAPCQAVSSRSSASRIPT